MEWEGWDRGVTRLSGRMRGQDRIIQGQEYAAIGVGKLSDLEMGKEESWSPWTESGGFSSGPSGSCLSLQGVALNCF